MSVFSCGLDFGTSNSTVGLVNEKGVPFLVPLEPSGAPMPSVLFFNFEDDTTYFGERALAEYVGGAEGRVMRALKSVLGSSLMSEDTRIRGNRLAFTKILEIYLSELLARSRAQFDTDITHVVAGRPVRFVDDDDEADALAQSQLEQAIKGVGFSHVEFQFEPIAAALDYERQISNEQLALVVDIGGGTSDFTIIRLSPERARKVDRQSDLLATKGVHVGGGDFDRLFSMAQIMPLLGLRSRVKNGNREVPVGPYFDLSTWHRINRVYMRSSFQNLRSTRQEAADPNLIDKLLGIVSGRYGHLLASNVEDAKIALTHTDSLDFGFAVDNIFLEKTLVRDELDKAIFEEIMKIPATIEETLRAAQIGSEQIHTLIMTGGSTQIPLLRAQLDRMFPAAKFVQTDAFGSVGLGLALDASRRF